jgi:hypothetical protein
VSRTTAAASALTIADSAIEMLAGQLTAEVRLERGCAAVVAALVPASTAGPVIRDRRRRLTENAVEQILR